MTARPNLINCWFVIDNSGSMAGSRWNMAAAGVKNCIGQLTSSDFMGILTFGNEIKVVHNGLREDGSAAIRELNRCSANGGGTHLYDAIIKAGALSLGLHSQLKSAAAQRGVNVITYMVLLTDGEDTGSKAKIADVNRFLATANQARDFKIVLAGVGLSGEPLQIMRNFGRVGDNDIEFRELRDNKDIEQLFEHVTLQISRSVQTLVVTERGAALVEQIDAVDLRTGQVTRSTQGVVMGAGGTTHNPMQRAILNQEGGTSGGDLKLTPRNTSDFWNIGEYDLSLYEAKALAGVCCLMPCCFCCLQPATLDTMMCKIPATVIAPCCIGECGMGIAALLFTPCQLACCPIWYCELLGHCCSGKRYQSPTPN